MEFVNFILVLISMQNVDLLRTHYPYGESGLGQQYSVCLAELDGDFDTSVCGDIYLDDGCRITITGFETILDVSSEMKDCKTLMSAFDKQIAKAHSNSRKSLLKRMKKIDPKFNYSETE